MIHGIPFHRQKQAWVVLLVGVLVALGGGIATALVPPGLVLAGFVAMLGALWLATSIQRLIVLILGFNLLADGLRDALDPN